MTSEDPVTKQNVSNAKLFKRALIKRGIQGKNKGIKAFPLATVWRQVFAVMTHHVDSSRLEILHKHFELGETALVITGTDDILVHPSNSTKLRDGMKAQFLELPGAGHGANEQCASEVNAALDLNVRRAAHAQCHAGIVTQIQMKAKL